MVRHWRTWALAIVVLWLAVVTVWALNPIDASVRTGRNADGTEKTATVQCDSPLSGNTSPTGELPALGPGEAIRGEPCDGPVTSGRTIYVIDVLCGVAALIFLVASRGRFDEAPESARSDPSAAVA